MRSQRRAAQTVRVVAVTTSDDDLGDETETRVPTMVEGAIFQSARLLENADNDGAAVVQPAAFDLPGVHELDANDLIEEAGDLESEATAVWYVVGGSTVWFDRTTVPVQRTKAV